MEVENGAKEIVSWDERRGENSVSEFRMEISLVRLLVDR